MRPTRLPGWLFIFVLASCAAPPVTETVPIPSLPDDRPAALADLLARARAQTTAATEAFYVDNWAGLEESAAGLAATASRVAKAEGVPADRRPDVDAKAGDLSAAAAALRDAAKAKNVDLTTQLLQRCTRAVRDIQRAR